MKVIYRQSPEATLFDSIGIRNCYLKELTLEKDMKNISKKGHYHTFFEVHLILKGHQHYHMSGKEYKVNGGNLIIIPPRLKHRITETDSNTHKISVTFALCDESCFSSFSASVNKCITARIPQRINDNLKYILEESKSKLMFGEMLIQNRIIETVMLLLRLCGFNEEDKESKTNGEDVRLSMAKQYIKDNIELNPKLPDVASYCYLSTKQLTRLFKACENTTPALYIQNQKFRRIENLLCESDLSLKEISEKMNFSSEYHFNSFFKKIAGTPPGEYRTIVGK